jgi:superfamily II DNA or RNA helicase
VIPKSISRQFSPFLRDRGERYVTEGRVELLSVTPQEARARVRGATTYSVAIDLQAGNGASGLICDCPFAGKNIVCKHLWAVLMAIEAKGVFNGAAVVAEEAPPPPPKPTPLWKRRLQQVRAVPHYERRLRPGQLSEWPADRHIVYSLDLDTMAATGETLVEVKAVRVPGSRGRAQAFEFTDEVWLHTTNADDRMIAHMLLGANESNRYYGVSQNRRRFNIPRSMYGTTLRLICETGRCTLASPTRTYPQGAVVVWDDGPAWQLHLRIAEDPAGWRLEGTVQRPEEMRALKDVTLITRGGLLIEGDRIARIDMSENWPVVQILRTGEPVIAAQDELFDLAAELLTLPSAPPIDLPEGVHILQAGPKPVPRVRVRSRALQPIRDVLETELTFSYDGAIVPHSRRGRAIIDRARQRIVHRQPEAEEEARDRLLALGARHEFSWQSGKQTLVIAPRDLPNLVSTLVAEGWYVEAEDKRYRPAGAARATVSSGVDWFELEGGVTFGDQKVALPKLLAALRRGENSIRLDDGTYGILPTTWLERYAGIAALSPSKEDDPALRFARSQSTLLDALLAAVPETTTDEAFEKISRELHAFETVQPRDPPSSFVGELRPYQRDGLGWLFFLRRFGLGGCLADDMGLGKTVQVLALLEHLRTDAAGPSLVVVPRSLIFNWQQEAARFTPALRVRDYTGAHRRRGGLDPAEFDLLLTTYGTLRRDAPLLRDVEFEYAILDEAQAIKNTTTASAKAARLLRARHKLAVSGTPIENSLNELWSLFEFLNPGMLGAARGFHALKAQHAEEEGELPGGRELLARALRPFILRRTKEEVARDLPLKQEQTLMVELETSQRKLYDELRDHYRKNLLARVAEVGLERSKIHVLEALLRLRQAACHPGLIDQKRASDAGSKLDVLIDKLKELVAEGHKALVFSQFTSFLALVVARLDREKIPYEYLDGQTRDRAERVQHFQSEKGPPVFLISLRAGGQGLNLTAADYVFVLDPWWNPAVENQAIDRAHRIGQTRPVIAMRLIARDTVEEKVLELQQTKRELAEAILGADAGMLARITREDLELLLE